MKRRILIFMCPPALSGILAMLMLLMQRGIDGPFSVPIAIAELPAAILFLPADDLYRFPMDMPEYSWFLVLAALTTVNVGLFALAGFMSWMLFPSLPRQATVEESSDDLRRAGWLIHENSRESVCILTATRGAHVLQAEDVRRAEAYRRLHEQAAKGEGAVKKKPMAKDLVVPLFCLVAGFFFEAAFAWPLCVTYAFASMNGPGLTGRQRLAMTLSKMLDPGDALWGTLFFIAGVLGGLTLLFIGCTRLSQAFDAPATTVKSLP